MATAGNNFESRQKVLGYPVDVVNESEALSMIEKSWDLSRTMHVVTINAEMVIQAQKDNRLDRIIRHAHLIVPDGAGAVFALRLDGHDSVRVPGIELAEKALSSAAGKGIPVALLGSKAEIIEKLRKDLPKIHPGLNICASHDGYISEAEEEAVVREIAESKPGLLLVAMGVPRQEYFIDKWISLFPGTVIIGVGGSFDVFAGAVKRAPVLFQKLHLEWFYRLMKEPWRFNRMASTLPNFAFQVLFNHFFNSSPRAISASDPHPSAGRRSHTPKKRRARDAQDRSKKSTESKESTDL